MIFFSVADLIQKNANQFEDGRKTDDCKDWPFTLSIIVLFCYNTSTIEKYSEYKYWLISVKSKTMVPKSCPQSRSQNLNRDFSWPSPSPSSLRILMFAYLKRKNNLSFVTGKTSLKLVIALIIFINSFSSMFFRVCLCTIH